MIRHVKVETPGNYEVVLRDWRLAHIYCKGQGLEVGAAAHNPFHIPGARNVALFDPDPLHPSHQEFEWCKGEQLRFCGAYADVDLSGELCRLPVGDASQDFILHSHVIEHDPNVLATFHEADRVLRPGGTLAFIFPLPDSHSDDIGLPVTPLQHIIDDWLQQKTVHTHEPIGCPVRPHYHRFTLESMLGCVALSNDLCGCNWELVAFEHLDTKATNGQSLVLRKRH